MRKGYRGFATLTNYANRLRVFIGKQEGPKVPNKKLISKEKVVEEMFKNLSSDILNPGLYASEEFEGFRLNELKSLPQLLQIMMPDKRWRRVLLRLAEAHPDDPVFIFLVTNICSNNFEDEIDPKSKVARIFPVFGAKCIKFLSQLGTDLSISSEDVDLFCSMCCQTDISFAVARHILEMAKTLPGAPHLQICAVLERLSSHAAEMLQSKGSIDDAKRIDKVVRNHEKLARLPGYSTLEDALTQFEKIDDQAVHFVNNVGSMATSTPTPMPLRTLLESYPAFVKKVLRRLFHPYSQSDRLTETSRKALARVLAVACCSASEDDRSSCERDIVEASKICTDPVSLDQDSWGAKDDPASLYNTLKRLIISRPVISMGAIEWLRIAFTTAEFFDDSTYTTAYQGLLALLHEAMLRHPLQREAGLAMLQAALTVSPNHSVSTLINVKRGLMSSMMNLFMSGLPVEVLSAVADLYTNGSHIDKSLLSKFLSSAMRRVSYPFSAKFAHVIAKIIVDANLRYRTDEEKAMLREFFDETKESLEPELQKKLQAVIARQ